jgi:glycosyltransferase involved in cell wall biosynthesis
MLSTVKSYVFLEKRRSSSIKSFGFHDSKWRMAAPTRADSRPTAPGWYTGSMVFARTSLREDGLVLVLPVPFKKQPDGRLFCEEQATNGIDQWAEHFSHVTVVAPTLTEDLPRNESTIVWVDPAILLNRDKVTLVPLPMAHTVMAFARSLVGARRILLDHMERNRYLSFCIGGLIGDWAAFGARLAQARNLPYSIHTDRVEHELLFKLSRERPLLRRIKAELVGRLVRVYHRRIIRGCALGLWHGNDCFVAYSKWGRENHLIHDIHLKPSDAIQSTDLESKRNSAAIGPLRIAYAGRLDPMKAPLDWLRALRAAADLGAEFEAVWLGDGPLNDSFHLLMDELGLGKQVRAPGFVDRSTLLHELRLAHVFIFTHVTPESPRCLLEALVSGAPIVGYSSAYAEELTEVFGGGAFVQIGDWQALGEKIAALSGNRSELVKLIDKAAENGKRFNDEAVFRERSELIRRYS